MQILRTEVFQTTASSGGPVLRVTFCGERGECVTVDLANPGHEGAEDRALGRATEVLVQTVSRAAAINYYDVQSNGSYDEHMIVAANDVKSQIYIFDHREGDNCRRAPPLGMPNLEAAQEEAVRCAVDLLVDLDPRKDALSGWLMRVYSENGELLFDVDVAKAEAARQTGQVG